jgi:hypothetical protein
VGSEFLGIGFGESSPHHGFGGSARIVEGSEQHRGPDVDATYEHLEPPKLIDNHLSSRLG